jgi:hypothetical protein
MTATPSQIRDLFLHPRTNYTSVEAAVAIEMSVEDVEGDGSGRVGRNRHARRRRAAVGELVSFAMGFWEQADIETALGTELAETHPNC